MARNLSKAFSHHLGGKHPLMQDTERERKPTVIFPIFLILFLVGKGNHIMRQGLIKLSAVLEDRI